MNQKPKKPTHCPPKRTSKKNQIEKTASTKEPRQQTKHKANQNQRNQNQEEEERIEEGVYREELRPGW